MMSNITHEFENLVDMSKWMDDKTKERTKSKVQKMKILVGYPEFIKNDTLLNEKYSEVFNLFLYTNIMIYYS